VTKDETEEGARRWRRHKEEGGSEEDTGDDGVRALGAEMDQTKSASEADEENESGDSSATEADEAYVEANISSTERREPRRRRNVEHRVVSDDESESEVSGDEEEQEAVNGDEEEEADDEASDMEDQELGERMPVVTRKRGRTRQWGNDTQGEEDHQQRLEAAATMRQGKACAEEGVYGCGTGANRGEEMTNNNREQRGQGKRKHRE
jgi:hypothetical protein